MHMARNTKLLNMFFEGINIIVIINYNYDHYLRCSQNTIVSRCSWVMLFSLMFLQLDIVRNFNRTGLGLVRG